MAISPRPDINSASPALAEFVFAMRSRQRRRWCSIATPCPRKHLVPDNAASRPSLRRESDRVSSTLR